MNFIEEFKKGQQGANRGLYMGSGLDNISRAISGVQKQRMYGVAGAPKAGKSTFVDYAFVINPLLDAQRIGVDVEVIYLSFEIDRITKEFDFASYFLNEKYGIEWINLPVGSTHKGQTVIPLSPDYLRGRLLDDENKIIKVSSDILEVLKIIYEEKIIPFFGEYDIRGYLIKKGLLEFIEEKNNPTGIYKMFLEKAKKEGEVIYGSSTPGRITGYKPYNPDKHIIVVTDHLRRLIPERGYTLKQTVDKYIEYTCDIRNWCAWTFIHVIHLNRSLTDVDRLKSFNDLLFPNADDIKDTGNLAEDADYLFTMFAPNDERYNLSSHFGLKLKGKGGGHLYPNIRSIHLVDSRYCMYPQHFRANMIGNLKTFKKFER